MQEHDEVVVHQLDILNFIKIQQNCCFGSQLLYILSTSIRFSGEHLKYNEHLNLFTD